LYIECGAIMPVERKIIPEEKQIINAPLMKNERMRDRFVSLNNREIKIPHAEGNVISFGAGGPAFRDFDGNTYIAHMGNFFKIDISKIPEGKILEHLGHETTQTTKALRDFSTRLEASEVQALKEHMGWSEPQLAKMIAKSDMNAHEVAFKLVKQGFNPNVGHLAEIMKQIIPHVDVDKVVDAWVGLQKGEEIDIDAEPYAQLHKGWGEIHV